MSVFDRKYKAEIPFTIEDISENPSGSLSKKCGKYLFENEFSSLSIKDIYVLEKIPELSEKIQEKLRELFVKIIKTIYREKNCDTPKSRLSNKNIENYPSFKYRCKYEILKMNNTYIIIVDKNSNNKNNKYDCEAIFHFTKKWEYIKVTLKTNLEGNVITKYTDQHWLDFFETYSKNMTQVDCESFDGILANIKIHNQKIL
jgi:hypothetical protein